MLRSDGTGQEKRRKQEQQKGEWNLDMGPGTVLKTGG